ncbi:MAG: cytochrome ubiquinol oxidase subunit I [Veillonellaceae bacterium]|nr:cytochrome ubiquinol oxidase subunit I [Veillonellaceae bacterium]
MMDALILARWQFGLTTIYHWLFVPVTLGLTIAIACMEIAYVSTKNESYKKMAQFWGKLFLINFAMGVVTGLVQEFQFGMNWSEYSRFMGDIFGAPLALEALTAFFLESTFMGAWIFGWDKLSAKAHMVVAILVAIGSNLSAFWILVANSFMQHPVGFALQNGRAEMVSFGDLVSNGYVVGQYAHIFTDGLMIAGIIIASVSAYYLIREKAVDFYRRSAKWGLTFAIIGGILVMGAGHIHGQYVTEVQPMKTAAFEALWETQQPAPFTVVANINEETQSNSAALNIPDVLSLVAAGNSDAKVLGIKDIQKMDVQKYGPGNYIPNVTALFWSFRVMVGSGILMFIVALISYWKLRRNTLVQSKGWLKVLFWMLPFAYLANATGWFVAEGGRQPWIVYGLQKTAVANSPYVTAGDIWTTIIGFSLIYILAAIAAFYLAVRCIKNGPQGNDSHDVAAVEEEAKLWK